MLKIPLIRILTGLALGLLGGAAIAYLCAPLYATPLIDVPTFNPEAAELIVKANEENEAGNFMLFLTITVMGGALGHVVFDFIVLRWSNRGQET